MVGGLTDSWLARESAEEMRALIKAGTALAVVATQERICSD